MKRHMQRIEFLGCPVDSLDISDALGWIGEMVSQQKPSRIAVVNANKLWLMSKNSQLANAVISSDLIIPEWAVYWGANKLGTPLRSYVAGVALMQATIPWAARNGVSLYFLGAKDEIIQALACKLQAEHKELRLAGWHHGYLNTAEDQAEVIQDIQAVRPDILFVATGSPKQELWIQDNFQQLNVPVSMGVGGSFDVVAGLKKDTPAWARGHGLEWLYRLSQDPKAYWKRYLVTNTWIIYQVYKRRLAKKITTSPV